MIPTRPSLAAFAVALLLGACGGGGSQTATSTAGASPVPSPLAGPSGKLNAEVPMPTGFPVDVPIYPGARLTSGAAFVSTGQASWGMEWETLDPVSKVQSYYSSRMPQGDWTLSISSSSASAFAGSFKRKSTSTVTGTLAATSTDGLTRILMSLVSASG